MADLITLADYKEYKRITKTDADTELGSIISSVSALVKTYCGHSFIDYYATDKVEIFNVNPNQYALLLNEWPIKSITSVQYRDSYVDSYSTLDASEYYADTSIDTVFVHSGCWPEGFGSVKVTYKAGYATTPEEVKIACLDLVHHYFKEEYKERKSIGVSSIDNGYSRQSDSKWPPHVIRVLDLYKNG